MDDMILGLPGQNIIYTASGQEGSLKIDISDYQNIKKIA